MDLPDARILEPGSAIGPTRSPLFGAVTNRDPPRTSQRIVLRNETKGRPRRVESKAEGEIAARAETATGREKPLRAQIPWTESA